ncbi:MAG TPA: hypothetical protein VKS60_07510 [Stellaceae bacterium]|nr:hypothetical protein [Stellaceae bacterium]
MIRTAFMAALLLLPVAAGAVTPAEQAFLRFQVEDKCIADAKRAHPGRDIASQQAVDVSVDDCLSKNNLPPRAHLAPPPAGKPKDAAAPDGQ